MAKQQSWLREHAAELIIGACVLPALIYAVPATYRTEHAVESQATEIRAMRDELRDVKQTIVASLLDEKLDKSKIIQRLVNDTKTVKGAQRFAAGDYQGAYAIWAPAASEGNKDSQLAISLARLELQRRAEDKSIPQVERQKAVAAMAGFGVFEMPDKNWANNQ